MSTMSRADEAREKRICDQQPFDYPVPRGFPGFQQPVETVLFSSMSGKLYAGDQVLYKGASRHAEVSCIIVFFQAAIA